MRSIIIDQTCHFGDYRTISCFLIDKFIENLTEFQRDISCHYRETLFISLTRTYAYMIQFRGIQSWMESRRTIHEMCWRISISFRTPFWINICAVEHLIWENCIKHLYLCFEPWKRIDWLNCEIIYRQNKLSNLFNVRQILSIILCLIISQTSLIFTYRSQILIRRAIYSLFSKCYSREGI